MKQRTTLSTLFGAGMVCMMIGTAVAQLPFGPPPVDDGFVPVGPPPAKPTTPVLPPAPTSQVTLPAPAPTPVYVPPAPTPNPVYVPPVPRPQVPTTPTRPPVTTPTRPTQPPFTTGPTRPAPTVPSRPVATNPPTTPGGFDSSLVGSRYAPQTADKPTTPQPNFPAPTTPQPKPGEIQFPVAGQPGGQVLASAEINEHCKVFARIGQEVVLGSEILPRVDKVMEANKDKIPPSRWETQRLFLIREALESVIDTKLIVADLRRTMPAENLPNLERQVDEQFEKNRVPKLMEAVKVTNRAELDAALRREGSSMAAQRRLFFENAVAGQWLRQSVKLDEEVTHEAMWRYYQDNIEDYRHGAEVDWQELHVSFTKTPDRNAAFQKIAQMGNDVLQRKVPLAQVAKAHSDGLTASSGGQHEKTTKGSLKSTAIDRAIFGLQPGQLSQIIEEPDGFYIVGPVAKRPERTTPFRDAQVKIKDTLRTEMRQASVAEYQDRLRKEIPIWTIFDDPAVAAKLPPMPPGRN